MPLLLAVALLVGGIQPSPAWLAYANARVALRDGRADDAIRFWLLRNAIESQSGRVSEADADFRSVTWAALGQLGLCPDGYLHDDDGAGLWPLALHNWLLKSLRRPPRGAGPSAYDAFALGRQQRHISLSDVLDLDELRALKLGSTGCFARLPLLVAAGEGATGQLEDKRVAARVLRHLLRQALGTLRPEQVRGRAVIEARIFDINLRIADLAARATRRRQRELRREGLQRGLSRTELADHAATETRVEIQPDSEEGRILQRSLTWPVDEWMALSPERRRVLFTYAARLAPDSPALQPLILGIVDHLVDARQGSEVQSWVALLGEGGDGASRRLVWQGERGRRLLALDRASGFRERSVVALHRGVDLLAAGELPAALRSFAHALRWAEDSRSADEVRSLARRWLSFVASQFRVTDDLFAMLRTVLPRADYSAVLEDQLWHAALGADQPSFERCVRHQLGRGAQEQRVALLTPLAKGDAGAFVTGLETNLAESPYFARRFLQQFVERMQAQDATVRSRQMPTLQQLEAILQGVLARDAAGKRPQRALETLVAELRAVIDGVSEGLGAVATSDGAYTLSPDRELFAGSLRVAPSDPLPWPFVAADPEPPSVFSPLPLVPEEWRDESGALVYGWRIRD